MKVGQAKPFRGQDEDELWLLLVASSLGCCECGAYTYYDDDAREEDNRNARPHKHDRTHSLGTTTVVAHTPACKRVCAVTMILAFVGFSPRDAARALKGKKQSSRLW